MISLLIIVFIIGYAAIALEHPLKINKSGTALVLAVLCWLIYLFTGSVDSETLSGQLAHHLSGISEILFFLMGAMTIVELIDAYKGFNAVTNLIQTNNKTTLLWIICFITFFLSAILDNLTSSIVMVSLLRKLISEKKERMIFASMVIIAANSGGAWSPIGDVTTTMLWIGGQITALSIMKELILPSIVSLLIPLIYQSFFIRGKYERPVRQPAVQETEPHSLLVFLAGVGCLISVPVFKTVTHLPPYMGMLLGLGIMWILTEVLQSKKEDFKHLQVTAVLQRIDLSSILFFLGILLAVAALESAGILFSAADWMDVHIANKDIIITALGIVSAIIDNVPLVAATMGMYPISDFPADHKIWEMIAYCAGTGGSLLIIGSAAGVVVMGMEKIEFGWYLRKISFTALLGYLAGVLTYLLMYYLFNH